MSAITASIRIENRQDEFAPGDRIEGTVSFFSAESWEVRNCDLVLFWTTEGRGTTDEEEAVAIELARPGKRVSSNETMRFSLVAPPMPWSYHGTLLKIHWKLGVFFRPQRGKRGGADVPISIHPDLGGGSGAAPSSS